MVADGGRGAAGAADDVAGSPDRSGGEDDGDELPVLVQGCGVDVGAVGRLPVWACIEVHAAPVVGRPGEHARAEGHEGHR